MRDLFAKLQAARKSGRSCAHCVIVETRGSTPQKLGATMIVFADGSQAGSLGGGCVEAEVRQRALSKIDSPEPILLDFTLDDDYGWDDGLICGGRMRFVVQPLPAGKDNPYFEAMSAMILAGRGGAEVVAIDPSKNDFSVGARFLVNDAGQPIAALGVDANRFHAEWPTDSQSRCGIAWLPIAARSPLLIVGAGHVGQAVAQIANTLDFDVIVADDREKYANPTRFPPDARLLVGDIGRSLKEYSVDPHTYCLIVTRGHSHDEEALYHLIDRSARYVGMIGSRRKIRLIFEDLQRRGVDREKLAKVYAPVGLAIGSQTAAEIAVSIVAQLVGHRRLGPDAFPPPVHDFLET